MLNQYYLKKKKEKTIIQNAYIRGYHYINTLYILCIYINHNQNNLKTCKNMFILLKMSDEV